MSVVTVNFETFSDHFHRLSIFQNHHSFQLVEAVAVSARMRIRLSSQSEEERNRKKDSKILQHSHEASLGDSSINSQGRLRLFHDESQCCRTNADPLALSAGSNLLLFEVAAIQVRRESGAVAALKPHYGSKPQWRM